MQDAHPEAPRSRHTEGSRTQDFLRQELSTDTKDFAARLRARARSGGVKRVIDSNPVYEEPFELQYHWLRPMTYLNELKVTVDTCE